MSNPVTRVGGASRLKKHFSFILAMISAATPHVLGASFTITHLPVFSTDFVMVSVSNGDLVRTSFISDDSFYFCKASFVSFNIAPYDITVKSEPSCTTSAFPIGTVNSLSGTSSLIAR